MSERKFDLVVIGSGPAASMAARKTRAEGKRVAIVECRAFGGTCALRGCNPKKVYVNAASLLAQVQCADGKLICANDARIDWAKLLAFKREFTDPVAEKSERSFRDAGIETYHGTAKFVSPGAMDVGDRTVAAERFFVATGARSAPLKIPGEQHITLCDEFLELEDIPPRVVFVGGGYISMEFAYVVARYGRQVTVLGRNEQILKGFDPDLTEQLGKWSREHGVEVRTGAEVRAVDRRGDAFDVTFQVDGVTEHIQCDLIVHGAGRAPNIDALDLAAGDVAYNEEGIEVNEFLASVTNPRVFAAGDCAATGQPKLTPTANEEARIATRNLFAEPASRQRPNYGVIPRVAFSTPPVAAVGLSQEEAEKSVDDLVVRHEDTSSSNSVRKHGVTCAAYKILIGESDDRIVGAHLLGPGADETINLFALAMNFNLTATDLKSTLFVFPTFASDVRTMV